MAKNILKEAIADAKAVREVALANAKAALEEAFTPKLQSMLSAKLSEDLDEEMYDEDMDEMDMDEMDMDEILNLEDVEEDMDEMDMDEASMDMDNLSLHANEEKDEDMDEDMYEAKKDEDKEEVTETTGCGCKKENVTISSLKSQLSESVNSLNLVKSELNEVNLLNSKLLYVNRIFKANNLDDSQKLRVVETLDKAESTKEAKLIYETIKDTFNVAKSKKASFKRKTKSLREGIGMASKAAGISTAPKKEIISESNDMMTRFQKLANIKIK